MKRLILLRHAKTEAWFEGVDDHGRALVPRGQSDASQVAAEIRRLDWAPSLVLISTARRARETWSAMAPCFGSTDTELVEALYLASPPMIEDVLAGFDRDCVMVIGHNPGLHDLACRITYRAGAADEHSAARIYDRMPTSCAALFEAEEAGPYSPTSFRLIDVIRAKDLRDSATL